jgi:hypothetical protein
LDFVSLSRGERVGERGLIILCDNVIQKQYNVIRCNTNVIQCITKSNVDFVSLSLRERAGERGFNKRTHDNKKR